jgi:hypothetical protein
MLLRLSVLGVNKKNEALQDGGRPAMKKAIRLSDVAAAAGVSLGTASNTFNRPTLVRTEVRELVQEAAQRLGYSGPDPIGRLLMGAKAHAIGVLPPGDMPVAHAVLSPFLRAFMLGVAEICDENDASLLVISGAENRKTWAIKNALVDGFILGHLEEAGLVAARQRKTPFVVMDVDAGPEVNSVRVDGRGGARRNTFSISATAALQFFQCCASRLTRSGIHQTHRSADSREASLWMTRSSSATPTLSPWRASRLMTRRSSRPTLYRPGSTPGRACFSIGRRRRPRFSRCPTGTLWRFWRRRSVAKSSPKGSVGYRF